MGIRVGVLAIVAGSLLVSSATADRSADSETFLGRTIGSLSSFVFVTDKNQTNTNTFWMALEGIDGPTLVLAEAMVGDTTICLARLVRGSSIGTSSCPALAKARREGTSSTIRRRAMP